MLNWPVVEAPISIEEFNRNLAAARDAKKRDQALLSAIRTFGYDSFLFGASQSYVSAPPRQLYLASNMGRDWIAEYEELDFAASDATVVHCLYNDEPLLWSTLHEGELRGDYNAEAVRVANRAVSEGYRVGVTIPMWLSWSFQFFGMSFCRRGSHDFGGHHAMFKEYKDTLVVLSRLFLTYFDFAEAFRNQYHLTARQWEVLMYSFSMDNNNDIAEKMGITLNTVRRHWKSTLKALDAHSMNEAQLKVLGMGALPRPTRS